MKIDFSTMEVHEYMDSHYNTYPIMNIDAEIEGRKAKLYIGPSIYITDGNVSAAYYGENYHYVYGEIIEKKIRRGDYQLRNGTI